MELFPVLSAFDLALKGGPCLERGREHAALALRESARLAQAPPLQFRRDEGGAPLSEAGWHWTQTHTRGLAAALVATEPLAPVGIDAEWLGRARVEVIGRRFPEELALFEAPTDRNALLLWTAKEALLKRFGIGVADLTRAILTEVDESGAWLSYRGERHRVHQRIIGDHLIAVAASKEALVCWPESTVSAS